MAYKEELAELMRQATKTKSQRAIAKDANVSQGTIGNMVMGKVSSREICMRVATAANISISKMLVAAGYEKEQSNNFLEAAESWRDQMPSDCFEELQGCIRKIQKEIQKRSGESNTQDAI
jgi:uncharacterized membrane protein YebE (DUF533 family)